MQARAGSVNARLTAMDNKGGMFETNCWCMLECYSSYITIYSTDDLASIRII
jgi:hypothetical protein